MNENVVIIEDDPGVRFFLEEALKGEKYSVSSFASYEEATNAIDKTTDLVIMDISLPGMDGLSATSDLNKNQMFRSSLSLPMEQRKTPLKR